MMCYKMRTEKIVNFKYKTIFFTKTTIFELLRYNFRQK